MAPVYTNGKDACFSKPIFVTMLQIPHGHFFGRTTVTTQLEGLTLTNTEYLHDKVDWHYHEKPYFTFLLQGGLIEGTKRSLHQCSAGALLFHNWEEPHYNIKPRGRSRGFHIELDHAWLLEFGQDLTGLDGDMKVLDPEVKFLFHRIHAEFNMTGPERELAIQSLVLRVLSLMKHGSQTDLEPHPAWVKRVREAIHDGCPEIPSLKDLAALANVHPVHLSRSFSRYFHCTLGEYVRKSRVEHALSLMSGTSCTLTDIAHSSGFADQSHFIRSFREVMGMSPSFFRRKMT